MRSQHLEETHHDLARMARAGADEHALAQPAQRRRGGLEPGHTAKVDGGRVDRFTTQQARNKFGRPGSDGVVLDVDTIAGVGLEDITRLQERATIGSDDLIVRPACKHTRVPAAADSDRVSALDRDHAARAGANKTDFDGCVDVHPQVDARTQRWCGQSAICAAGRFAFAHLTLQCRSALARLRAMSCDNNGFASTSNTPASCARAASAGLTKPLISTIGMSERILRISFASSEPVISGIASSDSTASNHSGAARNFSSAAALDVKPTGS